MHTRGTEAALHATRAGRNKIEQVDFDRAADRVRLGTQREEPFNDQEKRRMPPQRTWPTHAMQINRARA